VASNHGLSGINLLPKDRFENSSLGRFLGWATTTGRALVVITEFVVLLAFGSRFYFDKKLNDVSEVIDQKVAQIVAYQETEAEMRRVLSKQTLVKDYADKRLKVTEKYDLLSKMVPLGVSLEKMSIDSTGINISGESLSELGFAQLLRNLKRNEEITYINIRDTVYSQGSNSINFSIQMSFK
jgi:Tfp pilus assembly protein PilN